MQQGDMRPVFAQLVHDQMKKDERVWVVVGDLGFVMWDKIRQDFPDRFLNTGAAEQAMMGVATGLALQGKIPVVYSITPFLLYRPFETIRNYINYEKVPVRLVGSGYNQDYENEGFSHWSNEDKQVMKLFKNINSCWPKNMAQLEKFTHQMFSRNEPWYINLRRKPR